MLSFLAVIGWINLAQAFVLNDQKVVNATDLNSTRQSDYCDTIKCHSRASRCVNRDDGAQCVCDYPFAGDGINYCDECGLVKFAPHLSTKIVGGFEAVEHSFPFIAHVEFYFSGLINLKGTLVEHSFGFYCAGTLIDRRTVLTAAHCASNIFYVYGENDTFAFSINTPKFESCFSIYLGLHNLSEIKNRTKSKYSVRKVVQHENYDTELYLNDIALLILDEPVSLDDTMQIACLPDPKVAYYPKEENIESWLAGWGTTEEGGYGSETLQTVKITIYEADACSQVWANMTKDWSSQICAGELKGGKDSCQGDSGGGLFIQDRLNGKNKLVHAGIVSYGEGCAEPNLPGIYTRTSHFTDWILKNKFIPIENSSTNLACTSKYFLMLHLILAYSRRF